jgi:hypothetical protein
LDTLVANPAAAKRAAAAATSSVEAASTPRWFSAEVAVGFSNKTNFSGGSAITKLA